MRRIRIHLVLAALASFAPGCVFVDANVTLPKLGGSAGLRGGGLPVAVAVPFADERPFRDHVGIKKNGYNMSTARVRCQANPPDWIACSLEEELSRAGCRTLAPDDPAAKGALVIEGALLQLFCEPMADFSSAWIESDMHVRLLVRTPTRGSFERTFFVKGMSQKVLQVYDFHYQEAVDTASQRLVSAMGKAVLDLAAETGRGEPSQPIARRRRS